MIFFSSSYKCLYARLTTVPENKETCKKFNTKNLGMCHAREVWIFMIYFKISLSFHCSHFEELNTLGYVENACVIDCIYRGAIGHEFIPTMTIHK